MKTFTTLLLMLFLWSGCVVQLQAQSRSSVKIGKASEVRARFEARANEIKKGGQAQISQQLPGQQPSMLLKIKSSKKEGSASLFYGETNNAGNSNFYLKVEGENVTGAIVLTDQKKYYSFSSTADGSVLLTEEDIDEVLCIGYEEGPAGHTVSEEAGLAAVPYNLESLPGAEAVVLLDFDGETVTNTIWNDNYNNGEPIVAEPARLSEAEMVEVWKMISEDFRPFDLNITTSEAVFNNAPVDRRMRVIFTPTNYFLPGWGGYAYIGSFDWGGTSRGETPCWVWNSGAKYAGEAGSHEIGHTLYLRHDGRTDPYNEEYYSGHDSWAPIMGTGYTRPVVQWSKGEYPYANNNEDDLQIMATQNGFGYRADDHGNTHEHASPLLIEETGEVLSAGNNGVITTQIDVDVFSFTTSGGNVVLNVDPDPSHPNLDIMLNLRNSAGDIITTANPPTLAASIDQMLEAGTYYLEIEGVAGSLGANSDYASLGDYFISGNVPVGNESPLVSITLPEDGQQYTAPADIIIEAEASDADGSIAKVEFFNGDTKLGEVLEAPYSYNWSNVGAGSYSLLAIATDNLGATASSETVTVTVNENQSPLVTITAPSDGQDFTAPADIIIEVDASDPDGTIEKVEFFNGETKLGEVQEAPFTYSWDGVGAGSYTLTTRATDNKGASTTSASVAVTVSDNQAPVVSISSPEDGGHFIAPAEIIIEAEASDEDGQVVKVEFFNGETKLGEALEAPYTYRWSGLAAGTYSLTAKATDDHGASTTSAAVTITVDENESPIVSISSPEDGQRFTAPATINISADASDADGTIVKVEFYNGDVKLGEAQELPYSYSWSNVSSGSYTLTARATDNLGATAVSTAVRVTVSEDYNQSPVVSITAPGDGHSLTIPQNPIHIMAAASDEDGTITKVEFFNGVTKLGEVLQEPYAYSWRQPHTGTYSITARATDNMGASTTSEAVEVTVVLPGKGNSKNKDKGKGKGKNKSSASRLASSAESVGLELTEPGIYPNPVSAKGMLNIDLPQESTAIKVTLHELSSGKKVAEKTYSNSRAAQLDVSPLSHGLYGITITAEDKVWIRRLIVLP